MKTLYLITGGTGFLGSELTRCLSVKATIHTLGRSEGNSIICNLANEVPSFAHNYQTVVHNAGKAHITPRNKSEREDFFNVNYQGTLNLLAGIEKSTVLPKSFVLISTVAVYGAETGILLDEETPLNATDPYGLSKVKAEEAVLEWGKKHNVTIAILRLPLVAGPKPPGNLAKMLKAQRAGYYFQIGKGEARRSMVCATDVANIIPVVTLKGGIYNLTDQHHPSFAELALVFSQKLLTRPPYILPFGFAKILASVGDIAKLITQLNLPFSKQNLCKMTKSLTFSDDKAKIQLHWSPQLVINFFKDLPNTHFLK
jgi:nucleoside-diphosphate-sugar epimerase